MSAGDSAVAVIGKSVQIRGEVKGSQDLMVDGHVEGTITLSKAALPLVQTHMCRPMCWQKMLSCWVS